jgi:hypothetical protein
VTISQPNPDVRPTGEEPAEFLDPPDDDRDRRGEDGDDEAVDPTARPTGSPPAEP